MGCLQPGGLLSERRLAWPLHLRLVYNTTLDHAGTSVASVTCPIQCKRSKNGIGVYSSVAYGMQHNARIDSSFIPASLTLRVFACDAGSSVVL